MRRYKTIDAAIKSVWPPESSLAIVLPHLERIDFYHHFDHEPELEEYADWVAIFEGEDGLWRVHKLDAEQKASMLRVSKDAG